MLLLSILSLKKTQTKPTRTATSFFSKLWRERPGAAQTLLDLGKKSSMRNNHPKEKTWFTLRLFICFLSKHAHRSLDSWSQVFCKEVGRESPPFITTETNPLPCTNWCTFFQLPKANVYCFFNFFSSKLMVLREESWYLNLNLKHPWEQNLRALIL